MKQENVVALAWISLLSIIGSVILVGILTIPKNKECHGQCNHGSGRIECQQKCLKENYCPTYGEE